MSPMDETELARAIGRFEGQLSGIGNELRRVHERLDTLEERMSSHQKDCVQDDRLRAIEARLDILQADQTRTGHRLSTFIGIALGSGALGASAAGGLAKLLGAF